MMHPVVSISIRVAARMDDHRVWGRFDHEKPGFGTNQLLWLLGIVLLLFITAVLKQAIKRRASRTFTSDSSSKLFRELCAAHGLRRTARNLLKRLAAARGLKNAASLFVEPQHFEETTLPIELRPSMLELGRLKKRLFG
jgi:hypothetical protein